MNEALSTLVGLLVVLLAAKVAGEIFERLNQPAVIGELLAGMLLGPFALGWIETGTALQVASLLGVTVLMFYVGLETKAGELFHVGRTALIVGTAGVVLPLLAGFGFGRALDLSTPEALFVGTALVATSVGITARVLSDRGLVSTRLARIILAAAVIDDVLGMLVLSAVSGTVGGGLDLAALAWVGTRAVVFIGASVVLAPKAVSWAGRHFHRARISNAPFIIAIAAMLLFSVVAEQIGLAAIVGSFFAGMAFSEGPEEWRLVEKVHPLYDWLVPYFFVAMGAAVDVKLFFTPAVLIPGLVLTAIAVVTKVVGCGLGVANEGWRTALAIGYGMVPRGEVGLIVVAVGTGLGIVSPAVSAMVIMVVIASTIVVPPLLPALFGLAARNERPGVHADAPAFVDVDELVA